MEKNDDDFFTFYSANRAWAMRHIIMTNKIEMICVTQEIVLVLANSFVDCNLQEEDKPPFNKIGSPIALSLDYSENMMFFIN